MAEQVGAAVAAGRAGRHRHGGHAAQAAGGHAGADDGLRDAVQLEQVGGGAQRGLRRVADTDTNTHRHRELLERAFIRGRDCVDCVDKATIELNLCTHAFDMYKVDLSNGTARTDCLGHTHTNTQTRAHGHTRILTKFK